MKAVIDRIGETPAALVFPECGDPRLNVPCPDAAGDILTSSLEGDAAATDETQKPGFSSYRGPDPDAACPARVVKPSESDTSLPFHTEQMRYDVLR